MKRMLHDEAIDPALKALLKGGSLPRGPSPTELKTLVAEAPVAAHLGAGAAVSLTAVGATAGTASIALAAALIAASGPDAAFSWSSPGVATLPTQSSAERPEIEPPGPHPLPETNPVEAAQTVVPSAKHEASDLLAPMRPVADAAQEVRTSRRPKRRSVRRRPPPAAGEANGVTPPKGRDGVDSVRQRALMEASEASDGQETPQAWELEKRRSEVELIDLARKRFRRSPGQALRFLREHLKFFPDGVLSEERDYLLAQCASTLGLEALRNDAIRRLRARVPPSTYLHQLEKR